MVSIRGHAAAILGCVVLALSLVTLPATAADTDSEPVRRLGACLDAGGQGRFLLLLDTSASLQESDPADYRIEAADYLVTELAAFVERKDAKLEVAVSGFSDRFDVTLPWTVLDAQSASRVREEVDTYRDRDDGFETDYWTAVNGARKYLADRGDEGDCTALVWMSDGSYDLDRRDTAAERDAYGVTKPYGPRVELVDTDSEQALERAGKADLCRGGGVADAVRVEGITTLAVGLQGNLEAADFDLMKGIATSSAVSGKACGDRDGARSGAFVLAADVASLFLAFDEISDPDHTPITNESEFCQGEVCSEFDHRFVLDPSISSVRIVGGGDLKNYYAVLVSPSGQQVRIVPGRPISGDFGSFSVSGDWRIDTVFSVTVTRNADKGWTGPWRLVFVDPDSTDSGTARSNIRLFGDLRPTWLKSEDKLVVGTTQQMQFGLQRQDAGVVEPAEIEGMVALSAELAYSDGTTLPIANELTAADLERPVAVDLESARPGTANVRLTLSVTTAAAGSEPGTTLEPQETVYPVVVQAPPDYPSVPGALDFGSGEDAEPVTATLTWTGEGCVWLEDAETLTLADGVDKAVVSSRADSDATCETGELPLTLTPSDIGTGLVSGTLQVMTKPAEGSGPPIPVSVKYSYEMERPADQGLLWAVFAGLMALGLLIPLLLLLLAKWWTAKVPGSALSWLTVSGSVGAGSSFLNQEIPDLSAMRTVSLEGADRRRIPLTSRATLRAKAHFRTLSSPGRVVVEGGPAVTSAGEALPVAVQDHWIAVLDPSNPAGGQVEVTFLLAPGAAALSALLSDARAKVPGAVQQLRTEGGTPVGAVSAGNNEWGAPAGGPRDVDDGF